MPTICLVLIIIPCCAGHTEQGNIILTPLAACLPHASGMVEVEEAPQPGNHALQAIAAAGQGAELWKHIMQLEDSNHTLAAWRSVCKELHDMSFPLMSKIASLEVGSIGAVGQMMLGPASWSTEQVEQQNQLHCFLSKLNHLTELSATLKPGGLSQLTSLLNHGCISWALQQLVLKFG